MRRARRRRWRYDTWRQRRRACCTRSSSRIRTIWCARSAIERGGCGARRAGRARGGPAPGTPRCRGGRAPTTASGCGWSTGSGRRQDRRPRARSRLSRRDPGGLRRAGAGAADGGRASAAVARAAAADRAPRDIRHAAGAAAPQRDRRGRRQPRPGPRPRRDAVRRAGRAGCRAASIMSAERSAGGGGAGGDRRRGGGLRHLAPAGDAARDKRRDGRGCWRRSRSRAGAGVLVLGADVLPAAAGWLAPWLCRLVSARPILGGTLLDAAGAVLHAGGCAGGGPAPPRRAAGGRPADAPARGDDARERRMRRPDAGGGRAAFATTATRYPEPRRDAGRDRGARCAPRAGRSRRCCAAGSSATPMRRSDRFGEAVDARGVASWS